MRRSLIASLVLHGALLAAALVVLQRPEPFKVEPQKAITVDISKIEDVSKRQATVKAAEKPKEQPAPKKVEPVKKTEPAPKPAEEVKKAVKEPEAAPPKPEPKKEEPKKEVTRKEQPKPLDTAALADTLKTLAEKPPEKKPEKKAEKKPEKKKPKLDVNEIAAFLNKTEEQAAPERTSELASEPAQGEANIQGTDDRLAATFVEALVQRIRECWTVPPGAREANIVVKVRFGLNRDGTVIGFPVVQNPSADPLYDATARSAVAAVMECQAYGFLPPDKYDLWKDLIINFNPNMMFDS